MKINGIKVTAPKPRTLVIPLNGVKFVLKAKYVDDFAPFDALCTEPNPPTIVKENLTYKDFRDARYLEEVETYSRARVDWIYITSLSVTEGLVWDKVKADDPTTWKHWRTELQDSGMPILYAAKVRDLIDSVNGFDPERLDEATESFLASAPKE